MVNLPDDDPTAFEVFMKWLYSGGSWTDDPDEERNAVELARRWILGDKLGCPLFCEHTMDRLIHLHRLTFCISPTFVDIVFNNSHVGSRLCRFAVIAFIMDSMNADLGKEQMSSWATVSTINESFSTEVTRLMPFVVRYFNKCHAHEGYFRSIREDRYREIFELLLKRNPTADDWGQF